MAFGIGKTMAGNADFPSSTADHARGHWQQIYKLRALRAPMYDAKTGKKCQDICLVPGRLYTFGRSRSSCDIVFLDGRVSRQHCQVFLDPVAKQLFVFEGASHENLGIGDGDAFLAGMKLANPSNALRQSAETFETKTTHSHLRIAERDTVHKQCVIVKQEIATRCPESFQDKPQCDNQAILRSQDGALQKAAARGRYNVGSTRKLQHYSNSSDGLSSVNSQRKKPSLNGLFVDGQKIPVGGYSILSPGCEVSFIACTKEAQPVDAGFGQAVGFVVDVDYAERKSWPPHCSAEVEGDRLCIARDETNIQDSSILCLKRPLGDVLDSQSSDYTGFDASHVKVKCRLQENGLDPFSHVHAFPLDRQQDPISKLSSKQTLTLRKNQQGHKKTITGSLNRRHTFPRHPKSEVVLSSNHHGHIKAQNNMSVSCDLPRKENRDFPSERKETSELCRNQLRYSTCQFLSASDCARGLATRKDIIVDSLSIPRKTLTNAIEVTLGDCQLEGALVSLSPIKVRKQEDVSSGSNANSSRGVCRSPVEPRESGSQCFPKETSVVDFQVVASTSGQRQTATNQDDVEVAGENALVASERQEKQEARTAKEEKAFAVFEGRQQPYSSLTVSKTLKRSTTEIMRLLTRVSTASRNAGNLDGYNKLCIRSENERFSIDVPMSDEQKSTVTARANAEIDDRRIHEQVLFGSSAVDGEVECGPSVVPTIENQIMGPPLEKTCRPEDMEPIGGDRSPIRSNVMHPIWSKHEARHSNTALGSKARVEHDDLKRSQRDSGFLLNRLIDMEPTSHGLSGSVSLEDLLFPTEDLLALFVATFTSDILWFLTSHHISADLPVTVACHDHNRCWSTSEDARSSSPFSTWPNVTVLYPPFPDSCCFATEKRQGIGCHHPKIFLLPRRESIRVIITSANLTRRQWLHVTNSVWWQDFPRKKACDFRTLFSTLDMDDGLISHQTSSDFAVHLSSFVASLTVDVPSASHWALDLAKYDFSTAAASLVTSIPGLHGCPCPPVPQSIWEVVKNASLADSTEKEVASVEQGVQQSRKLLAAVSSNVVGINYRFKDSADPNGKRVRALAEILSDTNIQEDDMLTVQLRRTTNVAADPNAVSVIVSSEGMDSGKGMIVAEDLMQMSNDCASSTPSSSVHLGFLPRSVAKWVAPLYDSGLCTFAARVWPNEVLGIANGLSKRVAQIIIYVFEGRSFSILSADNIPLDHKVALACLLRNMERPLGLSRLHQVLSRYNWPDSAETDFIFGSSSIGTSLDAAFLAAFSAASGKKSASDLSDESDPEWGAWTAEHEAMSPSIGVVFPTIKRIRAAKGGPCTHQGIMCFAESTWERLRAARLLHDAVPFPPEREGFPMHVKVAQRRFQYHPGEIPYGWIYCGSHNFSPAAWGRPVARPIRPCKCNKTALGCALFISNYEVGLIFLEPPPSPGQRQLKFKPLSINPDPREENRELNLNSNRLGLDKFVLPFCVPPPQYEDLDQPATGRAIYSAVIDWRNAQSFTEIGSTEAELYIESSEASDAVEEMHPCLASEDANVELSADMQSEENYGETLWSQIDSMMLQ